MTYTNGTHHPRINRALVQIDTIHEKISGNNGIHDKMNNVSDSMRHLETLPQISKTLQLQTWIIGGLFLFIALIVCLIIVKGTDMRLNVPGWLEISGNQEKK